MIPTFKQLVVAIVALVLIDSVWLLTAGRYALAMTQRIQGSPVVMNWGAALIVYVALAYLVWQVKSVPLSIKLRPLQIAGGVILY